MKSLFLPLLLGWAGMFTGCASLPDNALSASDTLMADRAMQSRKYETTDEHRILMACVGVLQDLGFVLDESETDLGYVAGSKMRSAVDAKQKIAAVAGVILTGTYIPTDKEQKFRVAVCTRRAGDNHMAVRVTFQRIVWDTTNRVCKREPLKEPEIYQEFFERLSKAIFLDAQQL